jgi:hypothetical protein
MGKTMPVLTTALIPPSKWYPFFSNELNSPPIFAACSQTTTLAPEEARKAAAVSPEIPAPITIASNSVTDEFFN